MYSTKMEKRLDEGHDTKVVVGQEAENERKHTDADIYCRKVICNAVLSFFVGVVLHGLFIRG